MRQITKDSVNQSVVVRIVDATDGTPEQAVEHDTAGISLWYRREGATITAIVPATLASLDAAHADGGIEHIDDGYYRLDVPDLAFATGVDGVMIGGAVTGMVVVGTYIELVDAKQTGDSYAIVNHANYGNAQLVRSTTPANTLTVDANHEVTVPDTQRVLLANSVDHGGETAGITLNGATGLTSTTGIAANLTGSVGSVAEGGITAASFAANAIANAKIADGAISAAKIADDAITSAKIVAGDTGITLQKGLEMLAAFVAGKATVVTDGVGNSTITYLKRDGLATSFQIIAVEADGSRGAPGTISF